MRYDKRVTFHKVTGRGYDPTTGKNGVRVDEGITLPCNLSPVSLEKTSTTFGSVERKITTVRLQRPYKDKAEKAMIGSQKYEIVRPVNHRSESVFYVESVSEWT